MTVQRDQASLPSGADSVPAPLPPSKAVGHDSHAEGAHHAAHAENRHGDAPNDGAHAWADGLLVALHPSGVEEGAQFLGVENQESIETSQKKNRREMTETKAAVTSRSRMTEMFGSNHRLVG